MEENTTNAAAVVASEPSWPELLGSNNWDGLLDPLNLTLRRFLLRCGDFCQCTTDAFDGDGDSPYFGSSRYGKASILHRVKFPFAASYQVSSLLYATSTIGILDTWDYQTNFMGYVATSTDAYYKLLGRREIFVVWRGTESITEWIDDAEFDSVPVTPLLNPSSAASQARVMDGWLKIYTTSNPNSEFLKLSARAQLQKLIDQLLGQYKDDNPSIVVTGHSLGASLAVLSAFDLVENVVKDHGGNVPVTAIVFACPRVGDGSFVEMLQEYPNLKILHTKNSLDPVPLYPSDILGYRDAGVKLVVDGRKSPSLRMFPEITPDWHNLQGILHVVAGWQGEEGKFEVVVKRSLALVNKKSELLKKEYKIPGNWWVAENKGMGLDDNGEWFLKPPEEEDLPVPEFA
ncbi:phospholipase A1-IIdelta-like [Salvia hispanica]|uniref:phospholipase A1-IIdelta-like n=1 Tax=Salvia hispanica TaxID=49212 RepID=UPI002009C30F|nr:phospholipase A1-IIdelta-like [Salvia hispanica]